MGGNLNYYTTQNLDLQILFCYYNYYPLGQNEGVKPNQIAGGEMTQTSAFVPNRHFMDGISKIYPIHTLRDSPDCRCNRQPGHTKCIKAINISKCDSVNSGHQSCIGRRAMKATPVEIRTANNELLSNALKL